MIQENGRETGKERGKETGRKTSLIGVNFTISEKHYVLKTTFRLNGRLEMTRMTLGRGMQISVLPTDNCWNNSIHTMSAFELFVYGSNQFIEFNILLSRFRENKSVGMSTKLRLLIGDLHKSSVSREIRDY